MVVEFLRFAVSPEDRATFLEADAAIWTAALSRYPGFIAKETWIDQETGHVVTMIRWQDLNSWKSIPQSELDALDAKMGKNWKPIVEARALLPIGATT
ncbi:MAG: TIGR03792 family protein [Deinococcales bacterium]